MPNPDKSKRKASDGPVVTPEKGDGGSLVKKARRDGEFKSPPKHMSTNTNSSDGEEDSDADDLYDEDFKSPPKRTSTNTNSSEDEEDSDTDDLYDEEFKSPPKHMSTDANSSEDEKASDTDDLYGCDECLKEYQFDELVECEDCGCGNNFVCRECIAIDECKNCEKALCKGCIKACRNDNCRGGQRCSKCGFCQKCGDPELYAFRNYVCARCEETSYKGYVDEFSVKRCDKFTMDGECEEPCCYECGYCNECGDPDWEETARDMAEYGSDEGFECPYSPHSDYSCD